MIGYLITGGGGLLLGLGLMIWGLRERHKRFSAEKDFIKTDEKLKATRKELQMLMDRIVGITKKQRAADSQITYLRELVNQLRKRLQSCQDPKAIVEWFDSLSKEFSND